jgi:hypothetical protein
MDQSVKIKLDQRETRRLKVGRGVRRRRCLSLILFNLYSKYLNKEALEVLGDFKIGRHVICTVKYAVDLVLLTKEEMVLQSIIESLIAIRRCYGVI